MHLLLEGVFILTEKSQPNRQQTHESCDGSVSREYVCREDGEDFYRSYFLQRRYILTPNV